MPPRAASSTLIAVTDDRDLSSTRRDLLRSAEIVASFPLEDVRFVRGPVELEASLRTTLDVFTSDEDLQWIVPAVADDDAIGALAAMLSEQLILPGPEPTAITKT